MVTIKIPWKEDSGDKILELFIPILVILFGVGIITYSILFSDPFLGIIGLLPITFELLMLIISGRINFEYKV